MMLNELDVCLRRADGRTWCLGGNLTTGEELPLVEFRVENQIPRWRYGDGTVVVEKTILMPNLQNTVHLTFRIERREPGLRLELRPAL